MRASFINCNGASAVANALPDPVVRCWIWLQLERSRHMKLSMKMLLVLGAAFALPATAAQNGCPEGSYTVVVSPDRTTLSILFDKFNLESGLASKVCHISHPLNLPENMSLGVYKVDYRGFAKLAAGQEASLEVQYVLGPHGNEQGRVFRRKVKGAHEGDYFFTENIGAGQMKRVGCGADAKLNLRLALALRGGGDAMASLDSSDGKSAAMVYHLNLKKCH